MITDSPSDQDDSPSYLRDPVIRGVPAQLNYPVASALHYITQVIPVAPVIPGQDTSHILSYKHGRLETCC